MSGTVVGDTTWSQVAPTDQGSGDKVFSPTDAVGTCRFSAESTGSFRCCPQKPESYKGPNRSRVSDNGGGTLDFTS